MKAVAIVVAAPTALILPASGAAGPSPAPFNITDGPNGALVVNGNGDDNALSVFYGDGTTPRFEISPEDETISESSSHCTPSGTFPDRIIFCDYDVDRFLLKFGGGEDVSNFTSGADPWPGAVKLIVNGGSGDDVLRGADGDDTIKGAADADKLIGKNGSDKLIAKDGTKDRVINCGTGNDPAARVDPEDPKPKSC